MTQDSYRIREETPGDYDAIREVEKQAFGRPAEALLVDSLREAGAVVVSLVADKESSIVGHILFSPGTIESGDSITNAVALGPVAILPAHQNSGLGSALIRKGMDICRDMGHTVVFLLGHRDYYPRFGFVPGSAKGIDNEFGAGDAFMVAELIPGALDGVKGIANYRNEFNNV